MRLDHLPRGPSEINRYPPIFALAKSFASTWQANTCFPIRPWTWKELTLWRGSAAMAIPLFAIGSRSANPPHRANSEGDSS